jgi:hypothetical protein
MLTIREEQIEAFERRMFDATQERVERAIAATFPELSGKTTPGGPELVREAALKLSAIVVRGIESAVRFDIGDGPDIAAFIALGLALRVAPPGEVGDWISDYLKRGDTAGPTKLRMIEARLRALAADEKSLRAIAERVAQARERMAE